MRLANVETNPLEDGSLESYNLIKVDVTKMTRECLADIPLGTKEKDRCKNMFVLGFLYWMYDREMSHTIKSLEEKFAKKASLEIERSRKR